MKVVYRGRRIGWRSSNVEPSDPGDVLELLENNWDDFGSKTTFNTACRMQGQVVELGQIKIMFEDVWTSSTFLDDLLAKGWDGTFPIKDVSYLSVPSEITFYEQISSLLGLEAALAVAEAVRDASYLVNTVSDPSAIALTQTNPFRQSLQRERGSVKAFLDGWKIFARQAMSVLDLGFRFHDVYGEVAKLDLKFQTDGPLPHDINILIGANGAGKSQILHQIVRDWIAGDDKDAETGFAQKPNLSQIVVVSYSPFERFPVDLERSKLQDKDIYRYFGFRSRSQSRTEGKLGSIKLSHEAPKRNAAVSLLDCLADDQRYRSLRGWAAKLSTAEHVLRTAFDFDFAAVEIDALSLERGYDTRQWADDIVIELKGGDYPGRFIPIRSQDIATLDLEAIRADFDPAQGVLFFKDGKPIELSSGQKLFSFIVINILGAILRDSLVLVDEPELFLHPALEIQFIDMLKAILERFNSKALIATHSEVTVREVPSTCVHVLERTDEGLVLRKPPFQTFGGDIQRICSYVFGDSGTSKPFERWIREQLKAYDGAEPLITALGEDVNEELVIQIRALDRLRREEFEW